jgi:hypothetical protein
MAGTLTISTLSDGTNSTSATNCIQGSAKAWVHFTGSTAVVNASYNVSSITRNSAGVFVINFTTAFPNTNFCAATACGNSGANTGFTGGYNATPTTTTYGMLTLTGGGVPTDFTFNSAVFFSN